MLQHLFVYGTLRKAQDGGQHPFLRDQTIFIDQATLKGNLFHVAGYPAAIITPSYKSDQIHGEVYQLLKPALTLQILDNYEECSNRFPKPHEYRRIQQRVALETGESMQAWVYVYQRSITGLKGIENGDYFAFLPARHPQV